MIDMDYPIWGEPGIGGTSGYLIEFDGTGLQENVDFDTSSIEKKDKEEFFTFFYNFNEPNKARYLVRNWDNGDFLVPINIDGGSNFGFSQEIYSFDDNLDENTTIKIKLQNSSRTQAVYQKAYFLIYDVDNPSNKVNELSQIDSTDNKKDIVFADDGDGKGDDTVNAGKGNDIVFGRQGNDNIRGGEGNDVLIGGEGNDSLYGENGNDYLDGGSGADILDGGYGYDVYVVDNLRDVIIESPRTGIETVESSINWDLKDGSGLDHLYLKGNAIKGTGNNLNNKIYGNHLDNFLKGKDGNDTLDGGIGADTLDGGNGNDIYIVDNLGDVIIESPRTGIETVESSVSFDLKESTGLDYLYLKGDALNGTGNYVDNKIYGNYQNNRLIGKGGNDTLSGGGGEDTLIGGNGSDTFVFEFSYQGIDTITDFKWYEGDKIEISKVGFGASDTSQFSYNIITGGLFFDASPTDNISARQFATLSFGTDFDAGRDIVLV